MGGSDVRTNRKDALAEARAVHAEAKRIDYQQRKDDGRCTRRGCKEMAAPDSGMCTTCGPRERERVRLADRARRARRREAGRCIDCDAKSATCRCIDCQIKSGRIAKRALARIISERDVSANRPALATTIERDGRYPAGRIRTRYRGGQGRRGAPSKGAVDAADVALAIASLMRAKEKLDQLCNIPDKRARAATRADALAQVALAGRMIDEVVERNGQ